jgi:uncharacterized Zn finger protein (UPF0148 family)
MTSHCPRCQRVYDVDANTNCPQCNEPRPEQPAAEAITDQANAEPSAATSAPPKSMPARLREIAEVLRAYGTLATSPVVKRQVDVLPVHAMEDLDHFADEIEDAETAADTKPFTIMSAIKEMLGVLEEHGDLPIARTAGTGLATRVIVGTADQDEAVFFEA